MRVYACDVCGENDAGLKMLLKVLSFKYVAKEAAEFSPALLSNIGACVSSF